jgi:hypothetical protein
MRDCGVCQQPVSSYIGWAETLHSYYTVAIYLGRAEAQSFNAPQRSVAYKSISDLVNDCDDRIKFVPSLLLAEDNCVA